METKGRETENPEKYRTSKGLDGKEKEDSLEKHYRKASNNDIPETERKQEDKRGGEETKGSKFTNHEVGGEMVKRKSASNRRNERFDRKRRGRQCKYDRNKEESSHIPDIMETKDDPRGLFLTEGDEYGIKGGEDDEQVIPTQV